MQYICMYTVLHCIHRSSHMQPNGCTIFEFYSEKAEKLRFKLQLFQYEHG